MGNFWFRVRYTLLGKHYFGLRAAWAFSLPWVNGDLDRDGYSAWDAVQEDLRASL